MPIEIKAQIELGVLDIQRVFYQCLDNVKDDLDKIISDAVKEFDFESSMKHLIHDKIRETVETSVYDLDISPYIKRRIWGMIESLLEEE